MLTKKQMTGTMVGTDNEAADNLLTAATSAGVWDLTATDFYKSIYDAAVVTLAATNMLPTHMFVDPATYALIMQLKDTTDRTLFANLGGEVVIHDQLQSEWALIVAPFVRC